ncbi:hypothetical protein diail_770 [Diaporthe ilicicola]|nr:hypothetical protein diail_770 [Diaporthe ilicicola]
MACRSTHVLLALALPFLISALQVTPNSPCSSVCIDSSGLDSSDPNSSNTLPSDIVCQDAQFTSTQHGSKWKQCMTCLQNSTFTQGEESDQYWFIYNLRYSFDFCVFGFLDGTGSGSNPCETSSACGALRTAMENGNLSTTDPEFGYCDDGAVTGEFFSSCLNCVASGGDTQYVANALVALEAGCLQKPNAEDVLGLSASVFANRTINVVDPATLKKAPETAQLSIPAIAGIVIGAVVLVALISACVFIRCRKRRNRAAIGTDPRWSKSHRAHKRKSSFSFRCRNILASPMSPKFFRDELTPVQEHPPYGSLDAMATSQVSAIASNAASSPQERYYIETKQKPARPAYEQVFSPQHAPPDFMTVYVPEEEHVQQQPINFPPPEKKSFSEKRSLTIDTTLAPPRPARQSPKADTFSVLKSIHQPSVPPSLPQLSTHHRPTSHTSTTSSQSQTPSVRARVKMTTMSSQGNGYPNLTTPSSASPLIKQNHGWPSPPRESPGGWFPPPPPPPSGSAPRAAFSSSPFRNARKTSTSAGKKARRESGSPVETQQIQISFPAPPQR